VKLEAFFEKFDQFADAPDAVVKMRELVLQLAVHGKLVQQKKSDGNAANIFSEGLPPEAAARYEIAETWIWIRFAAVGEQRLGKMLDQKGNRGELKPYLRNTNVQWMRFQLDDIKEIRLESDELEEYRLLPGDLLICEGGEPGRCAIWRDADREMYFQKAIHRVRPRKGILSEYLASCLQVDAQTGVLANYFTGATIKHFTGRSLSEYSIPLPPLAEQKRIVAKVDELMALCDRLEAQQQEREARHAALARASLARFADAPTPANLSFIFHPSYAISPADLRKSILTLGVQGKLVPQDSNDESAEDSLARNDERRCETAQSDHRADKENQPVLSGDDRWDIPDTWSWRGLADLVLFVDYRGKTPAKLSSGVRLLTAKNVRKGRINLSPEEFLSESEYHAWMTRGFPKAGDVLFTTEAPMGNAAVVELTERFALAQRVICFQSYGAIEPAFLVLQILSDQFQSILDKNGTGVTAKGIKASKLKQLPIAIPPLKEQRRIVAKVAQLMDLVDELESQLVTALSVGTELLDAVTGQRRSTTQS
jgi:type I restriction enzyme S subunit